MPSISSRDASESIAMDGLEVQLENLEGGYTVCFESHTTDLDMAPLFHGLPEDRCQFPRWGYVLAGQVEFRFADHTEVYQQTRRTTCPPATPRCITPAPGWSSSAPRTYWAWPSGW